MEKLVFRLNEHLYLRDPQSTELGQKIIGASVSLIDHLGFENFTFKKLAEEIGSTEASVYRYFENKHRLLLYLIDWYWNWQEYQLDLHTLHLTDKTERLRVALRVLAEEKKFDPTFEGIDESALHRIVVAEMDKTYLTKQVDNDNKVGLFLQFKSVSKRIATMIADVNPHFPLANSLGSTVLLVVNQQLFFAHHLPSLSDVKHASKTKHEELFAFLETLVFKSISQP
jgi:AcrR family transcriptional regulator